MTDITKIMINPTPGVETKQKEILPPSNVTTEIVEPNKEVLPPNNIMENPIVPTSFNENIQKDPGFQEYSKNFEKDKQKFLKCINTIKTNKQDQTELNSTWSSLTNLGINQFRFFNKSISVLESSSYAKSKPTVLLSNRTVFYMFKSIKNSVLWDTLNYDTISWFQYRLLILSVRFLLTNHIQPQLSYGY